VTFLRNTPTEQNPPLSAQWRKYDDIEMVDLGDETGFGAIGVGPRARPYI
jgi:hypothetical protein